MKERGRPKKGTAPCELAYAGKEPAESILSSTPRARLVQIKTFPAVGRVEGVGVAWGKGGKGGKAGARSGWRNILISGDNLPALKSLILMKGRGRIRNSDSTPGVRLIYIDPPFSTRLRFRDSNKRHAYDDRLIGAVFIEFLRRRLVLMRELLSEDGSIYLHLDWKKAHYMKVVMDEVFGAENFLNDIVWDYGGRGAKAVSGQFSRNHDIILLYRKKRHFFSRAFVEKRVLKGTNGYRADKEGRWFKTSPRGDYTDESVRGLEREGRVYRTRNGNIRIKYFLREDGDYLIEERPVGDVWDDIPDAMHLREAEKTGYPTQKPEALLERVITASSKEGDIVLDAFAGSGTAPVAAERLGRRWIGIDSGRLSIRTIEKRLLDMDKRGVARGKTKTPAPPKSPLGPFILYRALV